MVEFRTLAHAKKYYALASNQKLPRHLRDQLLRSSSSIALNLSEGNAKSSRKDRLRIYEIAYGSFRESQTILDLAKSKNQELEEVRDHLGASLYKLTDSLK